ncbi:response regulator [bacterium]|nr:response regulator [bacterium]
MLTDELLAEFLVKNQVISDKSLRNAKERLKNVENENLEESLIFLGLVDYAKLGAAYASHYELPYYPVFHQGIGDSLKENFPLTLVKMLLSLPAGSNEKQLAIVSCQPDNKVCKSKISQLAKDARVVWRVASRTEINDAISKYYLNKLVKREHRDIELPAGFKIIDFEIKDKGSKTNPGVSRTRASRGQNKAAGKRIILIEPDHSVRNAISTLLTLEGYRVAAVVDENEAIRELSQEDVVYILKRRVFHSQARHLESFLGKQKSQPEIRYFGNLGGILLGEELSPEELFRNYLTTVKLLLKSLAKNDQEVIKTCHLTAHYARLLATSLGLKRKSQEALLLAVYLKEIGLYSDQMNETSDNNILSLIPVLPYEKSVTSLKEIEDSFGLSEIISKINQPVAQAPLEARIITLLLWFINGPGANGIKDITTVNFHQHINKEPEGMIDYPLAEELLQIINHEQHLSGMTKANGTILIIDPAFERDQSDLYDRFIKENYEVSFALTNDQALARIEQQQTILIVSEIAHENYNGVSFCESIKKQNPTLPFVFFSSENQEDLISDALIAGADDFISKESSDQVVFLKLNRLIQHNQRSSRKNSDGGVSGSLQEMGFMETVQILANREKDALIKITDQNHNQAEVYLHAGEIIYASCQELEGENAIYKLLSWEDGFFQVDTPKKLPERNVFGSTEAIMLEGCRLLDEESRDLNEAMNE